MEQQISKKNKKKVLFIADKWCSAKKKFGVSEWENNLWNSLKETNLAEVETFHFDDYYEENKKPGDDELIKKLENNKPDLICLVTYKYPGYDHTVMKWSTMDKIKEMKIPMVAIWGDVEIPEQVKITKTLLPYIKLNVATASSAAIKRINIPEKYIYMWVPKNPRIFNDPKKKRDINISYIGSPRADRMKTIQYLIDNDIPVYHCGGERQEHLTTEQYAGVYQRSKITISFSRHSWSHVLNARPFEAMLCGAMVLEQENFETPKFYIPFVDYVPYTNDADLLDKIKYYSTHDKEREEIAKNGYEKTSRLYSAEKFWQTVIDLLLENKKPGKDYGVLDYSNLSKMSKLGAYKLTFLERICSNKIGYKIYLIMTKWTKLSYWKYLINIKIINLSIYIYRILPKKIGDSSIKDKVKKILKVK